MRAIVEHMHTVGAMNCTTLPCGFNSSARRFTRLSSVPTSQRVPGALDCDRLDDEIGRAHVVRELAHLEIALGMADHHAARVLLTPAQHVLRLEHLVHRAMAFPQQDLRHLDLLRRQAAHRLVGIPDQHFAQRDVHEIAGPAPEVLVGEEQHFLAPRERPLQDLARIGRRAHDAAVLAAERFQVRSRVDVGDRGDFLVRIEHFADFAPRALDFGEIRHVRHRAAGAQVRAGSLSGAAWTGCPRLRP